MRASAEVHTPVSAEYCAAIPRQRIDTVICGPRNASASQSIVHHPETLRILPGKRDGVAVHPLQGDSVELRDPRVRVVFAHAGVREGVWFGELILAVPGHPGQVSERLRRFASRARCDVRRPGGLPQLRTLLHVVSQLMDHGIARRATGEIDRATGG